MPNSFDQKRFSHVCDDEPGREHQFMQHFEEEERDLAREMRENTFKWQSAWVDWAMEVNNIPEEEQWQHHPSRHDKWKKVSIADNGSGPVPWIKTQGNLSLAARGAQTIARIVRSLLEAPESIMWKEAAFQKITARHACLDAREVSIGVESSCQLLEDIAHLWQWANGRRTQPPPSSSRIK